MRAYYIPASAGVLLVVSAFVPWMHVGNVSLGGVPDAAGWWIFGLGGVAVILAGLSLWTRKNSRHPLLLVGLATMVVVGVLAFGPARACGEPLAPVRMTPLRLVAQGRTTRAFRRQYSS